jgi:hypothetical protein
MHFVASFAIAFGGLQACGEVPSSETEPFRVETETSGLMATGNCSDWYTASVWGGPVYAVGTAELQRETAGGTWTTECTLNDEAVLLQGGSFDLSGSWACLLTGGNYRISQSVLLYSTLDHVPTLEELAAFPSNQIFTSDGITATFACDPTRPPVASRTPGYWKNHLSAWPQTVLSIGHTSYDQACLDDVLDAPTRGDVRVKLIHHLIAAKLNILAGTDAAPISATIADADAAMTAVSIDCTSSTLDGSAPRGAAKAAIEALKDRLDAYNNNR